MQPPGVRQLEVPVEIEPVADRQTVGGPEIVAVEVEVRATVVARGRVVLQREPVAEHQLIGAREEAKIVAFEAG